MILLRTYNEKRAYKYRNTTKPQTVLPHTKKDDLIEVIFFCVNIYDSIFSSRFQLLCRAKQALKLRR